MSDGALLAEYARRGSESAFAELVRRHVDYVYSLSVRLVGGERALAEDVCQSVFIDLGRKAGLLTDRLNLTGWLHTSTCFAAAKAVRAEVRRRIRHQEAQSMNDGGSDSNPEPDWEKLRERLELHLLALKEPDREAILLRFQRGLSFQEMGTQIGLSENAARMRVERALERLRDLLRRKGINSTQAALAGSLAGAELLAAPSGLSASILSASAAVTAGKMSSLTFGIFMSQTKVIVASLAAAAVLLTPAIWQYRINQQLRRSAAEAALAAGTTKPDSLHNAGNSNSVSEEKHLELLRLRGEVAALRQQLATLTASNGKPSSGSAPGNDATAATLDSQSREFLQRTPADQGQLLGQARRAPKPGEDPGNWGRLRALAAQVRPNLDALEARPTDMAAFQSAFIQSVIEISDADKVQEIRAILERTYEQAVAAHLDAPSRPQDGVEAWATQRDALDRPATRAVQQLLTAEERQRFDQQFLGAMGIDVGLGDGNWHRFHDGQGTTTFPSEKSIPAP